jgi:hypothetical protein
VAVVRKDKDNKSKNDATVPGLEALVELDCDKHRLLACLQSISGGGFGLDDWRKLTGKDLRSLKGAINRFRQCANEIASINRHTFGLLLLQMGSKDLRLLPKRLQIYAAHLEATTKDSGPRKHPEHHAAKFFLVNHVKEITRRWCDEEVSALIDAVRDKTDRDKTYDAAAHKDWRHKNYDRLLRRFRPPSGLPPPPNAR